LDFYADVFYGDRDGYIVDPFGHGWVVDTQPKATAVVRIRCGGRRRTFQSGTASRPSTMEDTGHGPLENVPTIGLIAVILANRAALASGIAGEDRYHNPRLLAVLGQALLVGVRRQPSSC
jgi:hypothetical protein